MLKPVGLRVAGMSSRMLSVNSAFSALPLGRISSYQEPQSVMPVIGPVVLHSKSSPQIVSGPVGGMSVVISTSTPVVVVSGFCVHLATAEALSTPWDFSSS